ncbi:hypothetical protein FEK35_15125 [Nocardia cyriacigeorgica]|uniref:Uncharacterized protein n=1 Tax=Nocardia cyriacigeorgica TaxID=135487 RepID=A0A5R8PD26_9NOCA|nr:hypothetical protein FEK35_15125 [Nocardia cyriacigeorgica]
MSKTGRPNHRRRNREGRRFSSDQHIVVDSIQRPTPDLRKLARAVITIAMEETARSAKDAHPIDADQTEGGRS